MTAHTDHHEEAAPHGNEASRRGVYVYGIVKAQTPLPDELPSVGDDDTEVRLASYGQLSALISDLNLNRPLGTRDDLLAHERVLDSIAADATVLPIRFGAVVSDVGAITEELLAPNHEHFEEVLSELEGLVQYTIRGRYVEDSHLREIVAEDPQIRQLREALQGASEDALYAERVQLGELVNNAVGAKRDADKQLLMETLAPHTVASSVHRVSGEDAAFTVAFLVSRKQIPAFEEVVDSLGRQWEGRVALRLLGPLAAYDFLPTGA